MRNQRTFLLLLAAILLAVILLRQYRAPAPANLVDVVVANEDIEPYSFISASQLITVTKVPISVARGYYNNPKQVDGFMATRFIQRGQWIKLGDALPPEQFRYVADMKYEIVSFPAVFSEMVGGQVKPGHKINIYGYRRGAGQDEPGEMVLVASNVWVVDVRTATGEEASPKTESSKSAASQEQGLLEIPSVELGVQPASVVTVAAEPQVVQDIIANLGGKDYSAWVTLAPAAGYIATPIPPTPKAPLMQIPAPTPTAAKPETLPTILEGRIYMSDREGGPKYDVFPNNISVVWAVVELKYAQATEPIPIRIDIRRNDVTIFAADFTHPRSGQASYLLNPTGGFAPDTKFTTTLYAGGKAFSVTWETRGSTLLPPTGDDTPASIGN